MPQRPVPDSALLATVAASTNGRSNMPMPFPMLIVLLVTLAEEPATLMPVADPVTVMALPDATVPLPANDRQLFPSATH